MRVLYEKLMQVQGIGFPALTIPAFFEPKKGREKTHFHAYKNARPILLPPRY